MQGYVHSIQSLGAVDGPGVRFTVFMAGCNLRCGCCHNPDTWENAGASVYTAEEIVKKALRYKEYFGCEGGITLTGGEPLLQAKFAKEVFSLSQKNGINTCLDTSGSVLNDDCLDLFNFTDRVLLDIKYTSDEEYLKYVGCSLSLPLKFLDELEKRKIKTTVRQVIIPTLNDSEESLKRLKSLTRGYTCIDKFEFLPFKKLCQVKYDELNISFPFSNFDEPTNEKMKQLEEYFSSL